MEEESCGLRTLEEMQCRAKMEGFVDRESHYVHRNNRKEGKKTFRYSKFISSMAESSMKYH